MKRPNAGTAALLRRGGEILEDAGRCPKCRRHALKVAVSKGFAHITCVICTDGWLFPANYLVRLARMEQEIEVRRVTDEVVEKGFREG